MVSKGLSPRWQNLHKLASSTARRLASASTVSHLPVSLRPIADAQHAHVTFQQLLAEGGISVITGGFEICVNAPGDVVASLTARFNSPEDGGRSFPPRLRFTVAHELAHTFFFQWEGNHRKPRALISGTHYAELESLERECNDAAGLILVPEHLLVSVVEAGSLDVFDPMTIRGIADRFAASVDCLIIRLRALMASRDCGGGIFIVTLDTSPPEINACALDSAANQMFRTTGGQLDLERITRDIPIPSGGQETARCEVQVPCRFGSRPAVQQVSIAATRTSAFDSGQRSLVGIRLVGEPQLKG